MPDKPVIVNNGPLIESLRKLDNEQIESLTRAAPESCMSEISKDFTIRMLRCNREKILELNIP